MRLLDVVGCISRDLFLVRVAGGAAAAAVTFDLVLSAGGWVVRWTCGSFSCIRLRQTAVQCCAACLVRKGIGLVGGLSGLL